MFSLLSSHAAAAPEPVTRNPLFNDGVLNHFTTLLVTSMETKFGLDGSGTVPTIDPAGGALLAVIADSLQGPEASAT